MRERIWIDELKPTLQSSIPLRTKAEYYHDNKEKYAESARKYREGHLDEIRERRSEKYLCSCGTVVQKRNKYRHD
jgi:hypothetical protein